MKTRATSFVLATLAIVSLILPALALDPEELPVEVPETIEEIGEIEQIGEMIEAREAVLLDGEPAESLEFEIIGDVCYVTVSSFASLMDPEAMVEEENGIVSVNASAVAEIVALNSEEIGVDSVGMEQAANVVVADLSLTAVAGAPYFVANNRYLYAEDGLILINDRVAAPVRQLAQVYNLRVAYNAENDQVLLERQVGAEPYLTDGSVAYDGDTLYWLSRIINAESGNQPLEGKIAVGNVVMNRVNDPRFPDTLYDVLFQKSQFGPAASGSIYRDPNWDSMVAAMLVMDGAEVTPTALFFNGVRSRAPHGRAYIATIGDHAFYQ